MHISIRPAPGAPPRRGPFACDLAEEWPTLALLAFVYAAWTALILTPLPGWAAAPLLAVLLAQHASLQHELLHGHPFADARLNGWLGFPPLGLTVPYARFRDTHIAHHRDERLTDPYDDPESNFVDPERWARFARLRRAALRANNTLLGRMALGPAIGMATFWREEARAVARGDRRLAGVWAAHLAGAAAVLWLACGVGAVPLWAYLAGAYGAMSLLKLRTFLEHRADADPARRTAIVEDRGPLALLFLNNNFHAVHHAHPKLAWWRLPAAYRARRDAWLTRNGGYRYRSYAEVARRHLVRAKDPVPHPLGRAP